MKSTLESSGMVAGVVDDAKEATEVELERVERDVREGGAKKRAREGHDLFFSMSPRPGDLK
ncbi:hypothetical protein RchiOBHm_Chr4g0424611 [Rosa chinensis]|uniref:Uncharacterized protein n=1 Tax=Rosa chinensis TaxID=74649 RepID=A0A2P6QYX7_ROSCH|nr:hypothetical protein RchiOBHm_Chr4g0424611 [Rosa chinensis]